MIIEINTFGQIDGRKLMDIYRESNVENTDYFYPDTSNKVEALRKVECDYLDYIRKDFLANEKNRYMILENNGNWVCAVRLYCIDTGLYYIEALETHPEYRRKGYAAQLLAGVINLLKEQGGYTILDCVDKKNIASLLTHQKVGFDIYSDEGYDYLQYERDSESYGLQFVYDGFRTIQK